MKIFVVIFVNCVWLLSTKVIVSGDEASESAQQIKNLSESGTGLQFSDNYKQMLTESSSELDLLNDSAEVMDDDASSSITDKNTGLKFDDFVPEKELKKSIGYGPLKNDSFMNVYKVPKSKSKKTISTVKHSSIKNEPIINDFNGEFLFAVNDGNLTTYDTYFHAFTHLFDHNKWNANTFSLDVNKTCLKDVQIYLNALHMSIPWAVKVSDASGRYRGQFYFENLYWLGSKQFCEEINYVEQNNEAVPQLQFFVVKFNVKIETINHKKPRILDVGQCLPKSCSTRDITVIMNRDPASMILQQTITFNGNNSKANEMSITKTRIVPGDYSIWQDQRFYVFGTILFALLLLVICATIYEDSLITKGINHNDDEDDDDEGEKIRRTKAAGRHSENNNNDKYEMNHINNNNNESESEMSKVHEESDLHKPGFIGKLILCFSYRSNSRVILSAKTNTEDSLTCIHGLRFFTLLWTILVHTYLQMFGIGENRFYRNISERVFIYQLVGNATFSVDTFFFISGLLVVLLFLRNEKNKRKNSCAIEENQNKQPQQQSLNEFWVKSFWKTLLLVFYRFIRLTPAYLFIMVLTELGVKVTYNQSVFTPALSDHVNCNKFFWRNLMYVNNFYPLSEMCMMWSWYLANDFQFYVITIFLLILSTRYFKISILSAFLFTLSSWLITIYISLLHNYTHKVSDPFESFDFLYDKPWQRFGPYFMGMVTGYILYRVKEPPKIPFIVNMGLWLVSLFTLVIVIFGVGGGQLSRIATSFYVSLGHTAWGFALIWITLSCSWGLAKPVNSLLSYNGFFPLSRLTYCTYLIHPTVMMLTSFRCESPVHLNHAMILTAFFGNAVVSFLLAFLISILVEAPVIRLLKVLLKK